MNDLKVKPVTLMLDRERHLLMDLNALQELEEIYEDWPTMYKTDKDGKKIEITDPLTKGLQALSLEKKRIKHIKNFLYAGLVYEDRSLTPDILGQLISFPNLDVITDQIWQAIMQSLPDAKEGVDEVSPGEA